MAYHDQYRHDPFNNNSPISAARPPPSGRYNDPLQSTAYDSGFLDQYHQRDGMQQPLLTSGMSPIPPSPGIMHRPDHTQYFPNPSPMNGGMPYHGEAPRRQARRYKTVRKVKLTGGNLVLENPVPTKYLQYVQRRDAHEFTHMRYTAATCDPSKFVAEKYQLRQQLMGRETELFIVLTMYNVSKLKY